MNDLTLYDRCAEQWWDPHSPFAASLHALNHGRLSELRERLAGRRGVVADLGCGGGLIAEPLAALGLTVLGVDLSAASLRAAMRHGQGTPRLGYVRGDATRTPLADRSVDVIVCADVLEHVPDWRLVFDEATRIAKPGALFYLNTINRTWRSRILAVWLAEGVGLIPRGTHDHRMFIKPDEAVQAGVERGWRLDSLSGQRLRVLKTLWQWRLAMAPCPTATWGSYSAWLVRR